MIRQVLPVLAVAALGLAAQPAAAQVADARGADTETRTMHVAYGDLDLAKPAGARTLMARLHGAAAEICEAPYASYQLQGYALRGRCIAAAVAAAVRDVNSPMLTALQTGRPVTAPVVLAAR